ncbi:cell adhesion molecule CEACAM5-like [Polymixia lowei]
MFTTTLNPPETQHLVMSWTVRVNGNRINIIMSTPSGITIGAGYEDRITLNRSTASLELRNLALNDSGEYQLSITAADAQLMTGDCQLKIYGSDVRFCSASSRPPALFHWVLNGTLLSETGPELRLKNIQTNQSGSYSCQAYNNKTLRYQTSPPSVMTVLVPVSNVVVTHNPTDLVEFNSSVSLSCSSSGSSLSYRWLNGSSEVTASDGGSTLTIVNVTRYDQGPFRCLVSNPISHNFSDPVQLSISFGPEKTNLKISPSKDVYEEGSDVSLFCSASSRPPALFHWVLNGTLLSETGPELRLKNIQTNQGVPVSNVVVTHNPTDLVEFNSSVSLSCSSSGSSGSSGSSLSYRWLNGSSEVTASDTVQLGDGGSTLTIVNVTRYDQGPFRCNVSNAVSSGISHPLHLIVNYGPNRVTIAGRSSSNAGRYVLLHCSAKSVPPATFTWLLNGKQTDVHGDVYIIPSSTSSDYGQYTCTAKNDVTGLSETVHHVLSEDPLTENPYVMRRGNYQDLQGNDQYEGFCVDMLRELADILKFSFKIKLVDDGLYGAPEPNGSWTGMVGELINRGRKPGYFSFLDPFSPAVWLFMLLAYLAVSCVLFLAARNVLENQYTLGNSLWFPVGGFMQQGSEIMPCDA